jgi:hypothetical protein
MICQVNSYQYHPSIVVRSLPKYLDLELAQPNRILKLHYRMLFWQ